MLCSDVGTSLDNVSRRTGIRRPYSGTSKQDAEQFCSQNLFRLYGIARLSVKQSKNGRTRPRSAELVSQCQLVSTGLGAVERQVSRKLMAHL